MVEQAPEFAEYLAIAQTEADRARFQVDLARQQFEQAQNTQRFWDTLIGFIRQSLPAQALLLLRRQAEWIKRLPPSEAFVVERLRQLYSELEQRARPAAIAFGRTFPSAAREAGIEIDSTSRHPRYSFSRGFLRLEVDETEFTAKLVPRDGQASMVGLDLGYVIEKIKSEQHRLFERELNADVLLRSLYTAYSAVLRAEGRSDGDEVPLRRVTNRLAKNLNRFAPDEFNVDLSRIVQRGDLAVDGKRLHLNHTRNQRQGMLLHGLESGGYVGFISFKPERQ